MRSQDAIPYQLFVVKGKGLHGKSSVFEEATEVFRGLSYMPESISEDDTFALEQFVVVLYDRSNTEKQVNEARLDMFARK